MRFYTLLIVFFVSLLFATVPTKASQDQDSLIQVASTDPDLTKAVEALIELSTLNKDRTEEVGYLEQLLEKATLLDSTSIIHNTLFNLSRHYYNRPYMDSLLFWANQLDSLMPAKGNLPDVYYDVHGMVSKSWLYDKGYNEISINEVINMQNKAKETNSIYGQICSFETLGVIYRSSQRDSLAITSFEEAFKLLESNKEDLQYRIYILANQLQSLFLVNDMTNIETYLKRYNRYLDQWETELRKKHPIQQESSYRWMYYSFYTLYYIQINQLDKAKGYLDKSIAYEKKMYSNGIMNLALAYRYNAEASYCYAIGEYKQAIAAVDSVLVQIGEKEFITMKIDILTQMGEYQQAATLYEELLKWGEIASNEAFIRQIDQLRILHHMNDMNVQAKELKISKAKEMQIQRQLTFALIVMSIMILLLYLLIMRLKHFRRLKNILIDEKQNLIESQGDLQQAKVKAEKASQLKSIFVANISHEIRTPLNAIVGFSSLVVDPSSDEEEKAEYASVIHENSELLLAIINSVLDLSKMEAGILKLEIKPCELHSFCEEIVNETVPLTSPDVKLSLTFPIPSFTLHTDTTRLRQLLTHLLSNATKFTTEGSIDLSVVVDKEKNEVRFSVVDTGCGIPPEMREMIFDRFTKVNHYVPGAGLGLPICRMVAEYFGGSITLDPTYTAGARFIFIHPFSVSHAKEEKP